MLFLYQAFCLLVDLSPALILGHSRNPSLGLNFPCPASLLGPVQRFLNQVP